MSDCSFINLPSGRRIAYHLSEGTLPGVVFFGGFRSDMTGAKALALEASCLARGQRFLRFDYTGHGQSSGDFKEGCIGDWKRDALDMLDHVAPGKNILVGSSMGGWIMLLVALARKENVVALTGIATAPDFTERLIWDAFNAAQKKQLLEEGGVPIPDCYGTEPYLITRKLIEEARDHLLLNAPIIIDVPVRLIHGVSDQDVPWRMATELMHKLTGTDVALTLIKGGNHRLSEPADLAAICETVASLSSRTHVRDLLDSRGSLTCVRDDNNTPIGYPKAHLAFFFKKLL